MNTLIRRFIMATAAGLVAAGAGCDESDLAWLAGDVVAVVDPGLPKADPQAHHRDDHLKGCGGRDPRAPHCFGR